MIYLDNAATSFPKPEAVYRRMDEFARQSGNPGRGGYLLARRAGDHVVTGCLEHNAVSRPLAALTEQAGHIPLDMRSAGVDMLACPGHKGLLGPPGTGLLVLGPDVDLVPLREGGTGVASHLAAQPDFYPQRLESGTPDTVGIAGLGAALGFLSQVGLERIAEHERQLLAALGEGLAVIPSVKVYAPPASDRRTSLVSFRLEGWDPLEVATVLDQSFGISCRAGLHCAPWAHAALGTYPEGTVRFSVSYFNTLEEVEQAVEAVKALAGAERR